MKPWDELTPDEQRVENLAAYDRHIASVEAREGETVLITFLANDFVFDEVGPEIENAVIEAILRVLRYRRLKYLPAGSDQ